MKIKQGLLASIAAGTLLMATFHSTAMASPDEHCKPMQMSPEKIQERMKAGLDKMAERLEIKASQQASWEEFSKAVSALAEQSVKKPSDDADAATVSRYVAERASAFAKKLTRVADATARLQTALTESQRKILNKSSRRFLSQDHAWGRGRHQRCAEERDSDERGNSDLDEQHDRGAKGN